MRRKFWKSVAYSSSSGELKRCQSRIKSLLYTEVFTWFVLLRKPDSNWSLNFIFNFLSTLKLVSAIFYQIFLFHQTITLQKLWKMFLFHVKSSSRSWDIQIFVIFALPFCTFQIQNDKWKLNNLWCHELACINFQM